MCYGSNCPFEERYSGRCRKPHGMPCPQVYESESDYEVALAEAEALREESAEFTRDAVSNHKGTFDESEHASPTC